MITLRKVTADDVTVRIYTHYEHEAIASDLSECCTPEEIRALQCRVDDGDEWAWCGVEVRVTWNGIEGADYLGCCSYESEADFRASGCFADMLEMALDQVNAEIEI